MGVGCLTYQTALIKEIENQGMNAICVFSNGMPVLELGMPSLIKIFEDYFCENGVAAIDAFINTMKFSLTGARSMTLEFLKKECGLYCKPILYLHPMKNGAIIWKV